MKWYQPLLATILHKYGCCLEMGYTPEEPWPPGFVAPHLGLAPGARRHRAADGHRHVAGKDVSKKTFEEIWEDPGIW